MTISADTYFLLGEGVVTLCGSTKFFFETMEANRKLTFLGWVVLKVGSYGHSFHKFRNGEDEKDTDMIKRLHLHKIVMSDAIVIVSDSSYYMGYSTKMEIAFAEQLGKPVFTFLEGELQGHTNSYPPHSRNKMEIERVNDFYMEYIKNNPE